MFSQNREDEIIAGLFPSGFKGALLEIGAWDPVNFSNSRMLIEAGWSATLVEFSPVSVHELIKAYGQQTKVRVIAAAITPNERHVERFRITADALSEPEAEGETSMRWLNMRPGYSGGFYGHLWVPTLSVANLLSQFFGDRPCDFASVDTEGTSVEVAIALMQSDHRPRVMVIEHDGRDVELWQAAKPLHYEWIDKNVQNVIFKCRK